MDFVTAKAKVGGGGGFVSVDGPNARQIVAKLGDLALLLRVVVFLGQPHFGTGAGLALSPTTLSRSSARAEGSCAF